MRLWPVAVAAAVTVSSAYAQVGPELLLRPMLDPTVYEGRAAATYFFDSDIEGIDDADDVQLQRYFSDGRLRLLPGDRTSTPLRKADPRIGYALTYLKVNSDSAGLPDAFTSLEVSGGTGIAEFDGWVAGMVIGVGYAGDNAFGNGRAYYGAATLMAGRQLDKHSSLGLALDYNGNRSFMPDVPLPGVVYTVQIPERDLEVSLGFPFAYGRWRPIDALLLEVNFTFPDFVGARVSYDLVPGIGLFASLAQRTDAWRSELTENDVDRILFEQTLAEFGARFSIDDQFALLVAGGYAWKQQFRSGFDTRDTEEVADLDDGLFVRLEGQFSF